MLLPAVRPAFARNYPDLLKIYLEVQREAYTWILANTREAITIGSRYQQISEEDGGRLYQWSGMAEVLEQSDILALEADVKFLLDQDMISRSVNPRDFILPQAFEK